MKTFLKQVFLAFGLILGIFAKPQPHGFDSDADEGEISVPRSPKIDGPPVVTLSYENLTKEGNLECHIEGSPTPSVIWLKDGQETRDDEDPYTTTFEANEGTAKLNLKESAFNETKYLTGNFTCMAANFLGQVQKLFIISPAEEDNHTSASVSHPVPVDGNGNLTVPQKNESSTTTTATVTPLPAQNSTEPEPTSTRHKDLVAHQGKGKSDAISSSPPPPSSSSNSTANTDLELTSSPSSTSRNSSESDVTSTPNTTVSSSR